MFFCKRCGGHDIEEILDGQWTRTYWEWDKETQKYIQRQTKIDGDGSHHFECADCSYQLSKEEVEKLHLF